MRTLTASTACPLLALLAGISVGTATAQTSSPQRKPVPRPAPQDATTALPARTGVDGAANAADVWVNQVIGKILDGSPEDRGGPARPSR